VQFGALHVQYDGHSVVTVTADAKDGAEFERLLESGQKALRCFSRSKSGSDWGCDGVGYGCQKSVLYIRLNRSGVSRTGWTEGLERCKMAVL
jgi:hypothetical protein